jgi:hypothetical protein
MRITVFGGPTSLGLIVGREKETIGICVAQKIQEVMAEPQLEKKNKN